MTVETKIASLIKNNNRAALIRMASKYQEKGIKNLNKRDLATLVANNVVETETQATDRQKAILNSIEFAKQDVDKLKLQNSLGPDPFSRALVSIKSFFNKLFS